MSGMAYVDDTPVICIDGPVHPGSSGSPVFDDQSRVIGVIFAKLTQQENAGLAIPASCLTEFFDQQ